jgi:hypothetical protein
MDGSAEKELQDAVHHVFHLFVLCFFFGALVGLRPFSHMYSHAERGLPFSQVAQLTEAEYLSKRVG